MDGLPSREPLLSDNMQQFYKDLLVSGKSMQSLQKFKNIMIPALKRGEDDVGSYLQKHTAKSLFHLQKIRFLL